MKTKRISFDVPKSIMQEAKEKECDQIGLVGHFEHDIPENQAGGCGAYYNEVVLSDERYVGLQHVELSPGYGAAVWGKVMWVD